MNENMKIPILKISLLLTGLGGMTAQIILLRELLISFLGNELTLGVILANWLVLVAIGSFLVGKSVEKVERKLEIFVAFQLLFSAAFPFAIFLCRIFKNILLTTPGESLGLVPIFYSSLSILLPVSLPYGALFTYGCKLYSQYAREDASSIGKVYLLETIGFIIGGLLMTFLLLPYFNPFEIAFMISLPMTCVSVFLIPPVPRTSLFNFRNILRHVAVLLALLSIYLLITPSAIKIDSSSIQAQWRNLNVLHSENSVYGNITVTKRGEQYTFFTDGVPSITAPVPDIAFIEDFVHFPMLFHERPESILILSGGAGGMIHEILKYPVTRLDYVELDPLLLKLVQKFPTPLTQSEFSDKRVKIHYTDGRLFVQRAQDRFDIVFIGLPPPRTLQTNRLFTSEFFSTVKMKTNPRSIIVFALPGSLTYLSRELRDLNTCILDTLRSAYRHVRIIPGDVNLYLASDSEKLETVPLQEMTQRLERLKIKTSLITKRYIEYRLDERWLIWFWESMKGRKIRINSDFLPLGVFFTLTHWNSLFSPYLTPIFRGFEGLSFMSATVFIAIFTLLLAVFIIKMPHLSGQSLTYSIFTTGLTGMIFSLAILFTFQTLYGYLYRQIGLLLAALMAGIAGGSFFVTHRLDRIKKESILFLKTELLIALYSLLLPFVFFVPSHHIENRTIYFLLYSTFLLMSFSSGIFIGLQFPLAAKIYMSLHKEKKSLGQTAGLLYGADLFGGFIGGLLGGVVLLPVLGLKNTGFLMTMIKGSSALLFLLFIKIQRAKSGARGASS